jgi:AraC-like DNA-binding protein
VRSILRDNVRLTKTDYLHFLPFVIIFIGAIPFLFSSWEYKCFIAQKIIDGTFMGSKYNINFIVPKEINQLIRPPFALFYLVLIFRKFLNNRNVFKSFSHAKVTKIWLVLFFLFFCFMVVFYIIVQFAFYLNIQFFFDNFWFYYLINGIAFIYIVLNFSLVLFPQILYGLPIPNINTAIHPESNVTSLENDKPISNNKKSTFNPLISQEYKNEIELKINKWRTEQKFLESDASILTLATFADIPIHHISYYFNTFLNIKYTDWCNTLRIEYAKVQIDSGFNKNITLLAFSELCGFSSQSTFLRSFKNVVGSTPSDYIKTK